MVRGVKGRDKPTGVSLFKSWQAFEDEIKHIWENARLYNVDGSEISILAGQLEVVFTPCRANANANISLRTTLIAVWLKLRRP